MKQNLTLFSLLIMLISVSTLKAQTATPPASGNGTSGNPYQIATLNNLYWLSQSDTAWDKNYIQTADINAGNTRNWDIVGSDTLGFFPIGNNSTMFTGSYNGQNHTIDSLFINRPSTILVGLFGRIRGGEIERVGLTNIDVSGNDAVGGIVGLIENSTTVKNCYSEGDFRCEADNVGGLIGSVNTSCIIDSCYSTGSIIANLSFPSSKSGGLVGDFNNSTLRNSYSLCTVEGNYHAGSFVGRATFSEINNCFSTGSITSDKTFVGGFIGQIYKTDVSNCYSTGNVRRTGGNLQEFGAFCGDFTTNLSPPQGIIQYCYCTGSVTYDGTLNPTDKGFVGLDNSGKYNKNFVDTTISNQITATGATEKTTLEMHNLCTYLDSSWDFMNESTNGTNDYWGLNSLENNGYPFLKWQGYTHTESCLHTGVSDINNAETTIFPNPTENNLHLFFNNKEIGIKTIEIVDLTGKLIKQISVSNNEQCDIDVSNLNKGIYFLKIASNNNIEVIRFIKN